MYNCYDKSVDECQPVENPGHTRTYGQFIFQLVVGETPNEGILGRTAGLAAYAGPGQKSIPQLRFLSSIKRECVLGNVGFGQLETGYLETGYLAEGSASLAQQADWRWI